MKMSQQSRRTMLEKAGQKAGGTGGYRAENKQRESYLSSAYLGVLQKSVQIKNQIKNVGHLYHCSPEPSASSETLLPGKRIKWGIFNKSCANPCKTVEPMSYLAVLRSWIMVEERIKFYQMLFFYFIQSMSWNSRFSTTIGRLDRLNTPKNAW